MHDWSESVRSVSLTADPHARPALSKGCHADTLVFAVWGTGYCVSWYSTCGPRLCLLACIPGLLSGYYVIIFIFIFIIIILPVYTLSLWNRQIGVVGLAG
jgi:hypothetical protein